jgi:hypothetical protein
MTVLHLADEREAAHLAAFLSRLLHYDRSAAVRLQAAGRPPSRCSPSAPYGSRSRTRTGSTSRWT